MKTRCLLVCFAACAAVSTLTFAAEAEKFRTDKRVVISSAGPGDRPDKPREPVTFIGIEVGPAGGALAAQLKLPEGQGLVVDFVVPDSPATKAGLQKFDVLTRLDDQILIDPRQLSVLVRAHKEGDKVNVTYIRGGAETRVSVTLEKHLPPPVAMTWTRAVNGPEFGGQIFEGGEGGADVVRSFRVDRFNGGNAGFARVAGTPGAPVVTIFQPRANVVFADDAGTLEVRIDGGRRMLTAKDPKGAVVFNGPVNGPDERAALPDDVRKRLEKLESMGAFENLEMPQPPRPGGAPHASADGVSDVFIPGVQVPAAATIQFESAQSIAL